MKLFIHDKSKGPYPGRTWQQEFEAVGGEECMFAFHVYPPYKSGECNWALCAKPCSPDYHYCSKECADAAEDDREAESRAEALGS